MRLPPFKWPLEERQWEQVYRKITALLAFEWGQVSKVGSNLTELTTRNHADLQNINTAAYTHLTAANHTDLTDGANSALHYHDTDRARANHTGTQLAATISDFDAQVATTAALKANNLSDLANAATARTNIGLGNVDNTSDINKPVSTAQAAADAAILASAESYADGLVVGLVDDRGNYDASGNAFPSSGGSGVAGAILKGDLWTISVSGTLDGNPVTPGDLIRALVDTPGATGSNWAITENNLGYVAENSANKDVSGGYAGLTLFKLNLINALGTVTSWFTTAATVARTWTMPDKDGTVAMTSDITGTNSGTNTGDQASVTGNAGTATALQNARTINGVSFNGTANIQTATANTSDYATGTWTPTDASGAGLSFTDAYGLYTKIGNAVFYQIVLTYPVTANASNAVIGNFPYPITTGTGVPGRSGSHIDATDSLTVVSVRAGVDTADSITLWKAGLVRALNSDCSGKTFYISGMYTN
jgi:hypothetical protein